MKSVTVYHRMLLIALFTSAFCLQASAQIVVDAKDVTADKQIHYIQFLYYVDKSTFRPVYLIDYGLNETQLGTLKKQKLAIDKTEIKDSMSPIQIMNILYKAGWEYMGDETYVQVPMMEGWYSFTFKRRR